MGRSTWEADDLGIQTSQNALKQDVNACLEPYLNRQECPPFTPAELIIMILARNPAGLTDIDIGDQIARCFPYYLTEAFQLELYILGVFPAGESPLPERGLHDALTSCELPIKTDHQYTWPRRQIWKVDTTAARIFLDKYLAPPRRGVFRFLDLMPELRNEIYEYVLTINGDLGLFVEYGNIPGRWEEEKKVQLYTSRRLNIDTEEVSRGHIDELSIDRYGTRLHSVYCLRLDHLTSMLALCFVCKTVYKESMPLFFAANTFHFRDVDTFAAVIVRSPAQFGRHLSRINIAFTHDSSWLAKDISRAFEIVGRIENLQSFRFRMKDCVWLGMSAETREQMGVDREVDATEFGQIPAVQELVKIAIAAREFELIGPCPQLRSYVERLRAEMVKTD